MALLAVVLAATSSGVGAAPLALEHSLDGGRTWAQAGIVTLQATVRHAAGCPILGTCMLRLPAAACSAGRLVVETAQLSCQAALRVPTNQVAAQWGSLVPPTDPAAAPLLAVQRKRATAELERTPLSEAQRAQLGELLSSDGLYRLRVAGAAAGAAPVATSFPARCLAAAAAPGGLELGLLEAGEVAGIALAAPCACGAAPSAGLPALPHSQDLSVRMPGTAPEPLPLVAPPGQQPAGAGGMGAGAGGASGAASGAVPRQAGQAGSQAGGEEGGEEGGKKPEEEKTWLQKNWMMVVPAGFVVRQAGGSGRSRGRSRGGGSSAPGTLVRSQHHLTYNSAVLLPPPCSS